MDSLAFWLAVLEPRRPIPGRNTWEQGTEMVVGCQQLDDTAGNTGEGVRKSRRGESKLLKGGTTHLLRNILFADIIWQFYTAQLGGHD